MRIQVATVLLALLAWGLVGVRPAVGQEKNDARPESRARNSLSLILDADGPTSITQALTFTSDGTQLLAAGNDKVVRLWQVAAAGVDRRSLRNLRWYRWKEQRGAIYALAVDPRGERVAIGGKGTHGGDVAVLNLTTGAVEKALTSYKGIGSEVTTLTFTPDGGHVAVGKLDGSVWLWSFNSNQTNDVQRLAAPVAASAGPVNRVRLLAFTSPTDLLIVTQDGEVRNWNGTKPDAPPDRLFRFELAKIETLLRAVLSPDQKWLAVAHGRKVEVRSTNGKLSRIELAPLAAGKPMSLAFAPGGKRLAVGVRPDGLFKESEDHVFVYDLDVAGVLPLGLKSTYYPDALAFHPDGNQLAVAGGNDYELTVWKLDKLPKNTDLHSSGSSLWQVALAGKDRYLCFNDRRDGAATDLDLRGQTGKWRFFDLKERRPQIRVEEFQEPTKPDGAPEGWSVRIDDKDPYRVEVKRPVGLPLTLPWRGDVDGVPQCWTFLTQAGGKPPRLAVGHSGGFSVFEFGENEARRVRLCVGQEGEVTSLARSSDGTWLVSSSRDQTIAAWSLQDWPSQAELGAKFNLDDKGKLRVDSVDAGSPASEAGLVRGDEIVLFIFNANDFLFDAEPDKKRADPKAYRRVGDAAECKKRLESPESGKEFYFLVRRAGQDKPIEHKTTVMQRPLWRFFPTRDNDWVLWMWLYPYYDTSTHGDSFIGWHQTGEDVDRTPAYYKAEQMRARFHQPDVIEELLASRRVDKAMGQLPDDEHPEDMEPPGLKLEAPETATGDRPITLHVTARPNDMQSTNQQLEHAELWINDYRFRMLTQQDFQKRPDGTFFLEVQLPSQVLHSGPNQVAIQAYNKAGARGETIRPLACSRPEQQPTLKGLMIGINKYANFNKLDLACQDAKDMKQAWEKQNALYRQPRLTLLLDEEASSDNVLATLKGFKDLKPDDRLVVFFAGHGHVVEIGKKKTFVFCGVDFDLKKVEKTGISTRQLYEALADLPCRKVVILDACHSGGVASRTLVRDLTPGGRGPIILSACDQSQHSWEHPDLKHGLFTLAILEALDSAFDKADGALTGEKDGRLDPGELFAYTRSRVPQLIQEINNKEMQSPICFPRELDSFPLARK